MAVQPDNWFEVGGLIVDVLKGHNWRDVRAIATDEDFAGVDDPERVVAMPALIVSYDDFSLEPIGNDGRAGIVAQRWSLVAAVESIGQDKRNLNKLGGELLMRTLSVLIGRRLAASYSPLTLVPGLVPQFSEDRIVGYYPMRVQTVFKIQFSEAVKNSLAHLYNL